MRDSIDKQSYKPHNRDYEHSALLGEDPSVGALSFDARVPMEGRQSHEVDGNLQPNGRCEGVHFETVSLKRLLPWITASTVSGMTVETVNRSVKASATISMAVGVRIFVLR